MKNALPILVLAVLALSAAGPAPSGVQSVAGEAWDSAGLGNHRAVVRVEAAADAVRARIPWRRRDAAPEKKAVIVTDAAGRRMANVLALAVDRSAGEFVFQPESGPGEYRFYFMPFRLTGSRNYPNARYLEPEPSADPGWLTRNGLPASASSGRLPEAVFSGLQAIDPFDSFDPMEIIATPEETQALSGRLADRPFVLFPEDRRLSIRMTDDLPLKWIQEGPRSLLSGEADRGEFFAFQIGVWARTGALGDVKVAFEGLRSGGGEIPAAALRCINTGGTDWNGEALLKTVAVEAGKVQALWCGVQVPAAARPGRYEGDVTVSAEGFPVQRVRLALTVGCDKTRAIPSRPGCRVSVGSIPGWPWTTKWCGRSCRSSSPTGTWLAWAGR
jgi:hypothetical protein